MAPEMIEETALVKVEELNAIELFTPSGMDNMLARIKTKIDQHVSDVSTATGRDELKSFAYLVTRSKTIIDGIGKDHTASEKARLKLVDVQRKRARDTLEAWRDEVRQPLTDWEAAEKAKEDALHLQAEIEIAEEDAYDHEDFLRRERELAAKEAEMARKEAEVKAEEEAKRLEHGRKVREDRLVQEAKEKAEREAERKEQVRLAAEKAEKDKQERRAANIRHRTKVENDAVKAMADLWWDGGTMPVLRKEEGKEDCIEAARIVIGWISNNQVTNVTLSY